MELFWFAIAFVLSCFIGTECLSSINTVPNIAHGHEANLENIGMTHSQVPESAEIKTMDSMTIPDQLSEMNKVQLDILKILIAVSQNAHNTQAVFMKRFDELENSINEVAEKQNELHAVCGTENDNEHVETILDGKQKEYHSLNKSDLVDTIDSIKQTVDEIKRSTTLLTVTTIKKTELPYIPHCERTEQDDRLQSYEDVCLHTRLDQLYEDLSAVLQLHVAIIGDSPTNSKGRVELFYNGRHGSICDYWFGDNEAKVVCRMLGFTGGHSSCCGRMGRGQGEIMAGRIRCTGEEESLYSCDHDDIGHYEGDCNHKYDVGVFCDF